MIVIFDDSCPFYDNNSFLSTELTELSKFYEKIIVYPFTGPDNIKEAGKSIPQNIILRSAAYKKNSIVKTIIYSVKSFFRLQFCQTSGEYCKQEYRLEKFILRILQH